MDFLRVICILYYEQQINCKTIYDQVMFQPNFNFFYKYITWKVQGKRIQIIG